ncbi:MAG: hypothetical protein WCS73_00480 [Lentisphaeria bacterium]
MKNWNFWKSKKRVLIVAEEESGTRAIVIEKEKIILDHLFKSGTARKTVLEFGQKQGTREALFLSNSEIRELEVKLGAELDPEDRQSAIEYAAEASLGEHSGDLRISYMDDRLYSFRGGVVTSFFDMEEVQGATADSALAKQKFLGITSVQQFLISEYFSNSDSVDEKDAFLLFIGDHGILATQHRNKISMRNLPFGLPASENEEDDWAEKAQRRLVLLKHKDVTLYAPRFSKNFCEKLQKISEAGSVVQENWQTAVQNAALFFFRDHRVLIHPALLRPKARDPKLPGTIIGLGMFVTVLCSMILLIVQNTINQKRLEDKFECNQSIEKKVKQEDEKLKKLKIKLSAEKDIYQMLYNGQRVSKRGLLVVNLLERYRLQYTRINAISEEKDGVFISGETVWQPDLSTFFAHFSHELEKRKLALFSDGLNKEKDGRITFHIHVEGTGN